MTAVQPTSPPAAALWAQVRAFMLEHCGVVLADDQSYLMADRLGPVAKSFGQPSVGSYVQIACQASKAHPYQRALIDAMTTHESSFFRDPTFWQGLEHQVLPALARADAAGPVRIWSTACSHGQEVYSLAMLLEEKFPRLAARADIWATDISGQALERAQQALYSPLEVGRGILPAGLARHFTRHGSGHRVADRLRARIRFDLHNVMAPAGAQPAFDLILCRYVLIYFEPAARRRTLAQLWQATAPDGYIGLGTTEQGDRPALAPGCFAQRPPTRPAGDVP